jgi:type VI secretion system protein ImpH
MGTEKRQPHPALIERLLREPGAFEFFRAVQLLELHRMASSKGLSRSVGFDHPRSEVGIHFRSAASLAFPPRAVFAVRAGEEPGPDYEVEVSFLGLVGPAGTLPVHYTEIVLERLHAKDESLRDFLDAFQNRCAAFFYRAWKKYRLPVAYASTDRKRGEADPVLSSLLSLVGLNPRPRGMELRSEELAQVHHAGLFSDQRRSAQGLSAMLKGLLGCEVEVVQFVGQWIDLDPDAWSRLGDGPGPGMPARLGAEAVLGTRVWSVDTRVRIVAGPLSRERFKRLWPGGEPLRFLRELVRAYLGPLLDFDLVWELYPDAPASLCLGGDQQLGRDCWLGWSGFGEPDTRVSSPPWHNQNSHPDPSEVLLPALSV